MKHKLINKQTAEQTICDKVTIDGFDYYLSEYQIKQDGQYCIDATGVIFKDENHFPISIGQRMIVATNNPNIDIPKVVDEVFKLAYKHRRAYQDSFDGMNECIMNDAIHQQTGFISGYNKSQETHPFSEEDMIEFYEWCDTSAEANLFWRRNRIELDMSGKHHEIIKQKRKELLQLWKEQKPQKIYYTQTIDK